MIASQGQQIGVTYTDVTIKPGLIGNVAKQLKPAACHRYDYCRRSHLTLMIMPMMAVRLHVLLTITAMAPRVIPYTIHNISATDIRYNVFRLMPRCSRSLHTVNSCGIHDINPMAPAVSPIDSIIQSIDNVVF